MDGQIVIYGVQIAIICLTPIVGFFIGLFGSLTIGLSIAYINHYKVWRYYKDKRKREYEEWKVERERMERECE